MEKKCPSPHIFIFSVTPNIFFDGLSIIFFFCRPPLNVFFHGPPPPHTHFLLSASLRISIKIALLLVLLHLTCTLN